MSDPTLGQLIDWPQHPNNVRNVAATDIHVAALARELLALREKYEDLRLVYLDQSAIATEITERLTALESERAVGDAVTNVPLDASSQPKVGGSSLGWRGGFTGLVSAAEWKRRAETAERERDEALRARDAANHAYDREMDKHIVCETERDAFRDATLRLAAGGKLHPPTCRMGMTDPFGFSDDLFECGCGLGDMLAAALASATPAEGGEG